MTGIGDVLATARRARGLTQAELAEAASVTQAALSRYEHDLRHPEPDVLGRLARALGVTPALLDRGGRMEGGIATAAHMRRRGTAKATVWRELEARLNMLRLHSARLFDEVSMRAQNQVPTFDPDDTEPEAAARMVRAQWRMPVGPVHSVSTWLDAAGVLVVEEDFGPSSRVDGLSQWSGSFPIVLINASAPTDRKRLTLAHELGHLVLHSDYIGSDAEEQANAFAAEFLMPAVEIKPMLRGTLTLAKLANLKLYWGTSMQAIIHRGVDLGTLTSTQATTLYKMMSARGWRTQEPHSAELTPESPRLAGHIAESLARRGLNDGEVAQLAGFATPADNDVFATPHARARRHLQLA